MNEPRDWLDRFGRHFFPSRHTHLGDSTGDDCCKKAGHQHAPGEKCDHDHDHDHADHGSANGPGLAREILPWLRLSADLDPHRIETYVVAAYWLRSKLGKADQAEQFLREGLQENPGNPEILLELGRIYHDRKDPVRARNVFELSLRKFLERPADQRQEDSFLYIQILNQLALLEREQQNKSAAIAYYTALKEVSPNKEAIQRWIDWLGTNSGSLTVELPAD